MRLLFIHQNFPGQYARVAAFLAAQGHEVVALAQRENPVPQGVRLMLYKLSREASPQVHHYVRGIESAVLYGQAVLRACVALQQSGFRPDIVIGHNGWGEILFVKDLWPDVPLLGYFEFFYRFQGADCGFDPEFPLTADDALRLRMKNAGNLLGLDAADWGQVPTQWQRSLYPAAYQPKLSLIHEGIDTRVVQPNPQATASLPDGTALRAGEELITYVGRNLEPYRGFHVLMRALPEILRRRRRARVLIIGNEGVSYGQRLPAGDSYLKRLTAEVGDRIDWSRVHLLGTVPYPQYLRVLQLSAVHLYLTYPFVLSWSMLEAMAAGCLVVGSATAPVQEVIADGVNGLLVDFFDQTGLADRIDQVLDHPDRMSAQRAAARQTILDRYDFATVCLPQHLRLIETLAAGHRPSNPSGLPTAP